MYERTYYKHKEIGQYTYLVDEQAGYISHMRKATLVEHAADMAY
ncbi:UPF0236 family transposase-like protein [Thermosinus carboxydivorans]